MAKLDAIVETAPYRLVYLTGCSHRPNINSVFPHKFDVQFFPIFDVRSSNIFSKQEDIVVDKKYPFMCINAKDAPHRRYILGTLIKNNLLDLGVVSYQCTTGRCQVADDFNIHRGFSASQLSYIQSLFDLTDSYLPIKIDNSDIANGLPRDLFSNSYLGIVNETHVVNIPFGFNTSFVTEKTFNAIANNQMFIVVGQTGSLDLLHSLGYKTFDNIIDESYDTIVHNGDRLEFVAKEIVRFVSRPIEAIREDYIKVIDRIEHNKKLLYSQDFKQRLQKLVDQYA
jgi:hypothetical protein